MEINVSTQNVHQGLLQHRQFASCDLESLLSFGEQLCWCFLVEEEKGVLERPIRRGNWVYQEYNPISITLHPEAEHRLNAVLNAEYAIKQIIYGYEEHTPKVQPLSRPRIQLPDKTAETVASLAKATFILAAGAAMVVGYAFLMALSGIDPKLIVVLDTGANEKELPWVCLMSWEDEPENS